MGDSVSTIMQRFAKNMGSAFRETGLALDRLGCSVLGSQVQNYNFCRQRPMMPVLGKGPTAAATAYVANTAEVVGAVEIADGASVWPSCVLRGDAGTISIGENTNIQDRTVVSGGDVTVGDNVTVGHGAIISGGCEVQSASFIGMGSILGEGTTVESGAMVAAGAVVPAGSVVPAGEVWAGNPAKKMREMSAAEKSQVATSAQHYADLAAQYAQ